MIEWNRSVVGAGTTYWYIQLYEWRAPGWALMQGWQTTTSGGEPNVPQEIFSDPLPYRCAVLWIWLPTGHAQGGNRWAHSGNSCNWGDDNPLPGQRYWS